MALPLAMVGLGGALALVVLQGEQPGEGAAVEAVPGTSRPTLVSVHRSTSVEPTSGSAVASSVEEVARVERDVREAVRSGPSSATEVPVVVAAPAPDVEPESTVDERRQRGERSHRHRPTWNVTLLPTATPTAGTTVPDSAPPPTGSAETVPPEPTVEPVPPVPPVPPASTPAPEG